jgi:hypothetical protein
MNQIVAVRTITSLNYIKKTYNLPHVDVNSFEKQLSEEAKSTVVSEQQNSYTNPASFNYQYQNNVPVLSTTSQTYNETAKAPVSNEDSSAKDESENYDYYVKEGAEKSNPTSLGYYIIDNSLNSASGAKTSQKLSSPMQDRLNKIYNLNFSIEPGTIVNVTCY